MLHIGCHLSVAKGFLHMGQEALSIGADTFQFFTRNPRGFAGKDWAEQDIGAYLAFAREHGFYTILAHAPYTLNACSKEEKTRDLAFRIMREDLERLERLPGSYYNFHPGCHVGQGAEEGIRQITDILNAILTQGQSTTVLLETMAGKGTEVGRSFEELRRILDGVQRSGRMGVCLDTCHVYDAGYDIVNHLDEVLEEFDAIVGLDRLKAIHINDSKNPFASHKDRHEKIGEGSLGFEAFCRIINHPSLRHLPFYLETPNELPGYGEEIRRLRQAYVDHAAI